MDSQRHHQIGRISGINGIGSDDLSGEPHLIFGHFGKGLKIVDHSVRQVIFATLGKLHSEKPQQVHEGLERLYGNVRRLELFARRERAGWTTWGNDITPEDYNA